VLDGDVTGAEQRVGASSAKGVDEFGARAGSGNVLLRRSSLHKCTSPMAQAVVPLYLAACFCGILYVCVSVTMFTLNIEGLTGALLGDDAKIALTLWQMASNINDISSQGVPTLMWMLEIFFIGTNFIASLIYPIYAIVLWMVPLRRDRFRRLVTLAEVTYAWAMLDVFIVMVLASLLEINQFAQFIMPLDAVNHILGDYAEFHPYLPGENIAFGIQPSLDAGWWAGMVLVFSANCVGLYVIHCAHEVMAGMDAAEMASGARRPPTSSAATTVTRDDTVVSTDLGNNGAA